MTDLLWCWDLTDCIVPHRTNITVAMLVISVSSMYSVTVTGSLSLSESVSQVSPVMPQGCDVISRPLLIGYWGNDDTRIWPPIGWAGREEETQCLETHVASHTSDDALG